ncbi:helix-turn-helix domain-containing protein, partial [Syntrophaceticus schinkii]|uniref:helix-turn-helix domain-containing protein n=1 Tax=Syntrophaceticus schinkii TaxID=499207 RepID=UPI0018DE8526
IGLKNCEKKQNNIKKSFPKRQDCPIGYLSNLERNISSPTLEYMQRICEILGVSITDLLIPQKQEHIIVRKADKITIIENDFFKV